MMSAIQNKWHYHTLPCLPAIFSKSTDQNRNLPLLASFYLLTLAVIGMATLDKCAILIV
ncbi:hypothetical protein LP123_06260 [Moraxella bovis]|uniref:hypothetical protein n=1 Tax=Moraxella bovis TaxID=476 RepID=UPI0013C2E56D|nr:hypothetical protein [Moraxella bovis]UYZ67586.1 hypothetical protein LP122_07240 [Moraxella bovis]UYZ69946.1 hypothetical protein LP089_07275 [Moraxella bovis]UYZ74135.1 hypothetical protein LP105_05405 [Moraxella bovis]UYZ80060.1 hypothetical protein LP113_08350 [Moraxella bovis]UZA05119.1 hypothetical protein LP099_08045 [Moraxella bovis]